MTVPFAIADAVPLAPLTTLELGGSARYLVEAADESTVVATAAWATARKLPLLVLGGASNVVIGDAGFDGVVLRMGLRGLRFEPNDDRMLVLAAAGEPWDELVQTVVARGWAGVECLTGIPGLVGATPIQNVGAYGQEVSETIRFVRALDRLTGQIVELAPRDCGFAYRDSLFKRNPDAYVVLGVTFSLLPGGAPTLRYRELEAAMAGRGVDRAPTLADVSHIVRALRAGKSMVIDPSDPNRRSVGSFFMNPVLSLDAVDHVIGRAIGFGAARTASDVPQFLATDGKIKLSAAWLIEHAGFAKGFRRGSVGISSNHALALVHHGGGSTADLLALAHEIRDGVMQRFGVNLVPEPRLIATPW